MVLSESQYWGGYIGLTPFAYSTLYSWVSNHPRMGNPFMFYGKCKIMPYNYDTIQNDTIQYNTIQDNTIQYNILRQDNTIQYKCIQR